MNWDAFLSETATREAVERFRGIPWLNMRRELVDRFSITEATYLEPLWTAPGEAMYWQQATTRHIVIDKDKDGNENRRWQEDPEEWTTVGPLSTINAAQVAGYLERGLRFRPPGSDVQSVDEVSEPAEAVGDSRDTYSCKHPTSQYVFHTWKAYLRHCIHFNELPKHDPPEDVLEHSKKFRWFCFLHNIGWGPGQVRAIRQHMRTNTFQTSTHPPIPDSAPPRQEGKHISVSS